jgi:GTP-binding protein
MFIDERALTVRSGKGGDGIVAWRREKRVPRGGPAGGDGGRGGSVILRADVQLTTFADMEDVREVRAPNGQPGGGNCRTGASGSDRILAVPPGTTVYDAETGVRLEDLAEEGRTWVAAEGGRGGRGNAQFATATNQRPTHAEPGEEGQERELRLELRVLADVGLVGLPNAGKSTLLSRLSSARPRIADYPYTTLTPHLGIVEIGDFRRFVMADLPGLIEGAHRGHGLGDRFLRHLERTRVLVHLVELEPLDGADPVEGYEAVRRELEAYGRHLAGRPEVVAATKVDVVDPDMLAPALSRLAAAVDREVHPISAVTGAGLPELLGAVAAALEAAPPAPEVPPRA